MGYKIDENTYQFDDEREMLAALGLDIDTMEGDYREAYYHISRRWNQETIDVRFN